MTTIHLDKEDRILVDRVVASAIRSKITLGPHKVFIYDQQLLKLKYEIERRLKQ